MQEPTVTLVLPLTGINAVLNALATSVNNFSNTQAAIQQQAQEQLKPAAANDSNVVSIADGSPVDAA